MVVSDIFTYSVPRPDDGDFNLSATLVKLGFVVAGIYLYVFSSL